MGSAPGSLFSHYSNNPVCSIPVSISGPINAIPFVLYAALFVARDSFNVQTRHLQFIVFSREKTEDTKVVLTTFVNEREGHIVKKNKKGGSLTARLPHHFPDNDKPMTSFTQP